MIKDPTIALSRYFSVAPILNAKWTVQAEEDVDDEIVKFIKSQVDPWRLVFLEHALLSAIDFGWGPFEIVYGTSKGKVYIEKLKPLLQDITVILVNGQGAFIGFKQDTILVENEKALLFNTRVEGTQWYGVATVENIENAYDTWIDANNGARRYDKKIAG